MSDRPEATFKLGDHALLPVDAAAARLMMDLADDEVVQLERKRPSTIAHRRLFALMGDVAKRADNEFRDAEDVMQAVKAGLGHGRWFTTPSGMRLFREAPMPRRRFDEFSLAAVSLMRANKWLE